MSQSTKRTDRFVYARSLAGIAALLVILAPKPVLGQLAPQTIEEVVITNNYTASITVKITNPSDSNDGETAMITSGLNRKYSFTGNCRETSESGPETRMTGFGVLPP